jgi:capsular exopolysaccharide synthesis family protein
MNAKESEVRTVHLRDYWRVMWQGKWLVLAIATVVITLVAVATFLQTPIYRATATVEIQPRAKSISPTADFSQLGVTGWSWMAEERYLNTQMEIVRSTEIAKAAIEDLGLETHPQFASLDNPALALASSISLELLVDTYILEVSIQNTDPKMAQLLANGVVHAYIDSNIESALKNANRVIEELYAQVEPIRADIEESERRRFELARSNAFYVPEAKESTMENRLNQLEKELTELKIARGELEATFNAIEEIERRGESYESIPRVANDPIILDLKEQAFTLEQQIEELSVSYRDSHPKIEAVRNTLVEIPKKIETETAKIIAKIKTEYAIGQRRESDLLDQIQLAREEGLGLSETTSQIEMLDAEIKEDRRIYELITSRIKEIDLNQETLVNNIRLLQEASEPVAPIRPRKGLNLAAGLVLGLFLGVGTVFFIDYLDNTIKSSEDIERILDLPLLAIVPKFNKGAISAVNEAFQTLRTSILFASKGRALKTILVTSAGPGEGKSQTVVNLAKTLAQAGDRVVLLDGDLRRPTVHTRLNLERSGGLTNHLLNGEVGDGWMRYLKDVEDVEHLKVLTCGPLPPNPVELFGSERFAEMLEQLRAQFNWVLIDSPPLASLSDSIVLGSMVEMTVLVIKHNENDRDLIKRTMQQMRKVNANVIGAVLNSVDLKRAGYHDYYIAGYSYEGTREGQDKPPKKKVRISAQDRT